MLFALYEKLLKPRAQVSGGGAASKIAHRVGFDKHGSTVAFGYSSILDDNPTVSVPGLNSPGINKPDRYWAVILQLALG